MLKKKMYGKLEKQTHQEAIFDNNDQNRRRAKRTCLGKFYVRKVQVVRNLVPSRLHCCGG